VVTDPDGTPEEVMVAGGSGSFYARWAATRELVLARVDDLHRIEVLPKAGRGLVDRRLKAGGLFVGHVRLARFLAE
jgi:hypothetical protein